MPKNQALPASNAVTIGNQAELASGQKRKRSPPTPNNDESVNSISNGTHNHTERAKRAKTAAATNSSKTGCESRGNKRKSRNSTCNTNNLDSGLESDPTRHMDDPPDDINLREVHSPRAPPKVHPGSDMAPVRGGVVLDLDVKNESVAAPPSNNENGDYQQLNSVRHIASPKMATSQTADIQKELGKSSDSDNDKDSQFIDQISHIIVPSYSAWFNYNCIHSVERRALPEFFNNTNKSKTPEVYIAYRNFIIDTYRLNPTEYLSVTACRRNLAGDVCAIMRVHAFLEQWGLINYQVDPDIRPSPMGPPSTNHFHVIVDTPSGLKPMENTKVKNEPASTQLLDMRQRDEALSEAQKEQKKAMKMKMANNFGLKWDQYALQNANFQYRGAATVSREWNEAETLLLLEGIELFKDDWNKVCEHVGSRTQDECILHFLRLPIEDPFLAEFNDEFTLLDNQPIPFSKSGNPIMSTVAFLASVVDPRVASAAAKAALNEFSKLADKAKVMKNQEDEEKSKKIDEANSESAKQAKLIDTQTNEENTSDTPSKDPEPAQGSTKENDSKSDQENRTTNENKDVTTTTEKNDPISDSSSKLTITNGVVIDHPNENDKSIKTDSENDNVSKEVPQQNSKQTAPEEQETDKPTEAVETKVQEKEQPVLDSSHQKVSENTSKTLTPQARLLNEENLSIAAACALGAAAVKAKHLAAIEERKIKSLVSVLIDTQLKKLDIKMKHFEELESLMDKERETLEYQRQQLLQERQQFHQEQIKAAGYRARQQQVQNMISPSTNQNDDQTVPTQNKPTQVSI